MKNLVLITIISASLVSCSSFEKPSNQFKKDMILGFLAGAAVGAATAPTGEKREAHAAMWGSVAAAGVAALRFDAYDKTNEVDKLRIELAEFKSNIEVSPQSQNQTIYKGKVSDFDESRVLDLPPSLRESIKPTEISYKKVNEWRLGRDSNTHLFCETEVEFKPSAIKKKEL